MGYSGRGFYSSVPRYRMIACSTEGIELELKVFLLFKVLYPENYAEPTLR